MEGSVHVPLHILESLNISPLEPVLLKSCCHHHHHHQNKVNKPAESVSIIVLAVPRMDEYSGGAQVSVVEEQEQEQQRNRSNVARLLPFLEEFLVCAAEKFDNSISSSSSSSSSSSRISSYAPTHNRDDNVVIVQYVHVHVHRYRDGDGDGLFNEARIVARPFIIEKIDPELICEQIESRIETGSDSGPASTNQTFYRGLQVSLQLICTTNEEYDIILNKHHGEDDADAATAIADDYYHSFLMSQVKDGLECRTIRKGSFIAINLSRIPGLSSNSRRRQRGDECAIFYIRNVNVESPTSCETKEGMFYELGSTDDFEVSLSSLPLLKDGESQSQSQSQSSHGIDKKRVGQQQQRMMIECCPGYESLVQEIVEIAKIKLSQVAPSGVIISGCSGVGKTRLAEAVVGSLTQADCASSKIVSTKDIVLQASSSMDLLSLKKYIGRHVFHCKEIGREMIVIDDLDLIFEEGDDSSMDNEKRIARHAVIGVVDDLNSNSTGNDDKPQTFVLGICSNDTTHLSAEFTKIGRFEKTVIMSPPSEQQRSEILADMFRHLPINHSGASGTEEECCRSWGSTVARHTSGCVAADLKRMCIDALTRSKARADLHIIHERQARIEWSDVCEAARQCVPSQLAQLDVSIARDIGNESEQVLNTLPPRDAFFQFWDNRFAGHREMKSKIYRSIIWPWKRHEGRGTRALSELERNVPPPSGVLFHGPCGTGKTFAAECLASSLGLNVVRVRASDILDQWLGGSEAAIRAIFTRARAAAPCILFFDELDAIAMNREDDDEGSNDVHSRLLSTLLNEMDGVNSNKATTDLLIVGTTNRITAIDAALLRPGRFEEHILVGLPTISDIESMMKMMLRKVPLDPQVKLYDVAELLAELEASAADVKGICSEACLYAINNVNEGEDLDQISLNRNDFDAVIRMWKD